MYTQISPAMNYSKQMYNDKFNGQYYKIDPFPKVAVLFGHAVFF